VKDPIVQTVEKEVLVRSWLLSLNLFAQTLIKN
jgi:hypothetical protein